MDSYQPNYLSLYKSGELVKRAERLWRRLANCDICPRQCGAARLQGETGFCRSTEKPIVASFCEHRGEDPVISGSRGSGKIFFVIFNIRCCFCQNHSISQMGEGRAVGSEELAATMLSLQRNGCHNINFVSPTHVVPQILEALEIAIGSGGDDDSNWYAVTLHNILQALTEREVVK